MRRLFSLALCLVLLLAGCDRVRGSLEIGPFGAPLTAGLLQLVPQAAPRCPLGLTCLANVGGGLAQVVGASASALLAPPVPTALGAWVRSAGSPFPFGGVAWIVPVTVTFSMPALSETAFVTATVLGDGNLWLVGGQYAVPQSEIVGFDVLLDNGTTLPTGPNALAFQPRLNRGGAGWSSDGSPFVMLGGTGAVSSSGYAATLAAGDAWGLEVYTTGSTLSLTGLKVTVRFGGGA